MKKGLKNLLLVIVLGVLFIIPNTVNASEFSYYDSKNTSYSEYNYDSYSYNSYELNNYYKSYKTTKTVMNSFLLFLEGTLIYYAFKKEEKGFYK